MRKTLAAMISAAMIGCASPEPERTTPQPGEQVLRPVTPEIANLTLTFYEQVLNASDVPPANHAGHVTNLNALEAKIREVKGITPEMPADEQLRRIHNYLFDHNSHRYAHEVRPNELFAAAQPQRIIAADLQEGQRRVGSELGLGLEYFILAGRFGHEVTPYVILRNREKHLVFVGAGQLIDVTNPFGVSDAQELAGEQLTPANLLGLFLTAKGTNQFVDRHFDTAYQTLSRAYRIYPSADVTLNLGLIATVLGNTHLARQWYEQAITLDPKNPLPHERLGELSANERDFETARTHYWTALEFDSSSTNARLYFRYGETLFMLNRKSEAKTFFDRALQLEPYNDTIRTGVQQYVDACKVR